jgi:AraC family transcriptional regulator, arabinose operon regulatory protein
MSNPADLRPLRYPEDEPAPPPGLLLADHYDEPERYRVRRGYGTYDWLLTYTLSGQGVYRLDGQDYPCNAGDVTILLPRTPHDYRTAQGSRWNFCWAHFIPRPQWLGWLQLTRRADGLILLPIDSEIVQERISAAFVRLLGDSKHSARYSDELAQNALEEILLLTTQADARNSPRFDPRIEQALAYITAHPDAAISVDQLAAMVAMSPSGFAHLFKAQVGVSPMQMHLRLRLRQAARLLEYTARSVQEIALDLGFQSPFHFSRQFKAWYGVSPKGYRQDKQG